MWKAGSGTHWNWNSSFSRLSCLLLLLLQVLSFTGSAQQTNQTTGTVVDSVSNLPLAGVLVKVVNSTGETLSYTISSEKGHYTVPVPREAGYFSFSSMGYKLLRRPAVQGRQLNVIRLQPVAIELREVAIKSAPIKKYGDTINYSASLAGRGDKVLADLLRKLPGIEVSETGAISYGGKPINRFYIENMDMLGGKYGLATSNLPLQAIKDVQVIENNQHIKSLRKTVPTDQAAINIKLKSGYKGKLFGTAEAGTGLPAPLYLANGFGLMVSAKTQQMLNLKGNNTGRDVTTEAIDLTLGDSWSEELPPTYLSQVNTNPLLPISSERYLNNFTNIGSYTRVSRLSPVRSLKTGITITQNRLKNRETLVNSLYGDSTLITTNTINSTSTRDYKIAALAEIENNADSTYFLNRLKANADWQYGDIFQQGSLPGTAAWQGKTISINNYTQLVLTHGSQPTTLKAYTSYSHMPEQFTFIPTPGSYSYFINQNNALNVFLAKAQLNKRYRVLGETILAEINGEYTSEQLPGALSTNQPALVGVLPYSRYQSSNFQPGLQVTWQHNYGGVFLSAGVNATANLANLKGNNITPWSGNKVALNPVLAVRWSLNSFWQLNVSATRSLALSNGRGGYANALFTSPLSATIGAPRAGITTQIPLSLNLQYRNPSTALFYFLTGTYTFTQNNLHWRYIINNPLVISQYVPANPHSRTLTVNTKIDKLFTDLKIRTAASLGYTRMATQIQLNGSNVRHSSAVWQPLLLINYTKLKWLGLNAQLQANLFRQKTGAFITPLNADYTQSYALSVGVTPRFTITTQADLLNLQMDESQRKHISFLDAVVKYTSKKFDYSIEATNLLNTNIYSANRFTAISSGSSVWYLRPRQAVFSVKFKY